MVELDEVVVVGAVPDEVLLLCGRPDAVPSAWWTPALARQGSDDAGTLVAAARELLVQLGLLDTASGELSGRLGAVAAVVAAVELVLLLETERPDGSLERRTIIAAADRAVLDVQDVEGGVHDLLLVGARDAVALLVELLDPVAAGGDGAGLVGRRAADEVERALPAPERATTVRIMRSTVGADAVAHAVTVVDHPDGSVACWALAGGEVEVHGVDHESVVQLAAGLLGAQREVAA